MSKFNRVAVMWLLVLILQLLKAPIASSSSCRYKGHKEVISVQGGYNCVAVMLLFLLILQLLKAPIACSSSCRYKGHKEVISVQGGYNCKQTRVKLVICNQCSRRTRRQWSKISNSMRMLCTQRSQAKTCSFWRRMPAKKFSLCISQAWVDTMCKCIMGRF